MTARVEFAPRLCWVGFSWKKSWELLGPTWEASTADEDGIRVLVSLPETSGLPTDATVRRKIDLWVCLVPCLTVHFTWYKESAP